ncbi:MAG TPA: hypothetical protein VHU19_04765 [Pyrinomonadaceae bacterium]|nr:hypothetical protein [Pyrinomonadaceae bacterium]
MLYIESRTAELKVEKSLRRHVLEALQDRGLVPLIRASRLYFFEQALSDAERVSELERSVADWSDREGDVPYVRGDVFCFEDYAHFLIFGDDADAGRDLRAGIIYDAETGNPAGKLEAFCRNVQEAVETAARSARGQRAQAGANELDFTNVAWRPREGQPADVSGRFAGESGGEAASPSTPRAGNSAERVRAAEILEEEAARGLLQRLSEAHADGRLSEMLSAEGRRPEQESLVARLAGAGLVRREVQVSCRKDGRSLFRLPSPDALTIMTASSAVCSECGAALSDERAEELLTPTPLASALLKDGAWLANNLRSMLVELGIPEREIAARRAAEGETQLTLKVCGEPFLFILRDGDFNAAHARRALDAESETHATHIVVMATGKVQDEARARLREHARRRSRAGGETEVVFVEGLDAAPLELRRAIERVAQDALMRELYELDASAGFNVGYALAARFRLTRREGALQDVAASTAGALAGSLREF